MRNTVEPCRKLGPPLVGIRCGAVRPHRPNSRSSCVRTCHSHQKLSAGMVNSAALIQSECALRLRELHNPAGASLRLRTDIDSKYQNSADQYPAMTVTEAQQQNHLILIATEVDLLYDHESPTAFLVSGAGWWLSAIGRIVATWRLVSDAALHIEAKIAPKYSWLSSSYHCRGGSCRGQQLTWAEIPEQSRK